MMKRLHSLTTLLILFTLLNTDSLWATPRVVVSIAPVHSLVSALMAGVAEPELLIGQDMSAGDELDIFQKSQMITADMMIWIGPGLEIPMASALQQWPVIQNKMLTLSNYLPLLAHENFTGDMSQRQQSRNLAFWTDTHLAVMAVRYITPQLVRLDPEHQERYLDNEISLIKKLKQLEQEISNLFKAENNNAYASISGVDRYFRHRFMETAQFTETAGAGFQTVSLQAKASCPGNNNPFNKIAAGSELYFQAMRKTAESVISCANHVKQKAMIASIQH